MKGVPIGSGGGGGEGRISVSNRQTKRKRKMLTTKSILWLHLFLLPPLSFRFTGANHRARKNPNHRPRPKFSFLYFSLPLLFHSLQSDILIQQQQTLRVAPPPPPLRRRIPFNLPARSPAPIGGRIFGAFRENRASEMRGRARGIDESPRI